MLAIVRDRKGFERRFLVPDPPPRSWIFPVAPPRVVMRVVGDAERWPDPVERFEVRLLGVAKTRFGWTAMYQEW